MIEFRRSFELLIDGQMFEESQWRTTARQFEEVLRLRSSHSRITHLVLQSSRVQDHLVAFELCLENEICFCPMLVDRDEESIAGWMVVTRQLNGALTVRQDSEVATPVRKAALAVRTSGTSSSPRFAWLTVGEILECALENISLQKISTESQVQCSLKIDHVGALLTQILPARIVGAKLHFNSESNVFSLCRTLANPRISHYHLTPYMLDLIERATPDIRAENPNAVLVVGSSRISRANINFIFQMGFKYFLHFYGLSESPPPVLWSLVDREDPHRDFHFSKPGLAIAWTSKGEILLHKTAPSESSVIRTGDLGKRIGCRHRVFGRARGKESGSEVHVSEIEFALMDLPFVREAQGIRLRDSESVQFLIESFQLLEGRHLDAIYSLLPANSGLALARLKRNKMGKVNVQDLAHGPF